MRRAIVDTAHGQVHVRCTGEGPPVVLLHQTPRSSRMFRALAQVLAKNYSVYAFDTPGFGSSERLPVGFTVTDLAARLVEAAQHAGVASPHVLGFHTGNKVATEFAVLAPDSVRSVTLCGQTHSLVTDQALRREAMNDLVGSLIHQFRVPDASGRLARWWAGTASAISTVLTDAGDILAAPDDAAAVEHCDARLKDLLECWPVLDDIADALNRYDWMSRVVQLRVPTLVLELSTPEEHALFGYQGAALADVIGAAQVAVLDGAGLNALEWQPEAVASAFTAFARQHDREPAGPD